MRTARLSRATLALATVTALTLTATFLAQATSGPPAANAADPVAPSFLSWEGDPFADGHNHFLITASTTEVETDGWLRLGEDHHLVAAGTDSPQDEIRVGEIEDAVTGTASLATGDVLQQLAARSDINEVRSLGFQLYAVSGSIEAEELRAIPGISGVTVDSALSAASVDPYYPSQWALENDGTTSNPWAVAADADIDAPEGWHRTRGSGVVVAVIDSGVDVGHPDLAANIWHNEDETCDNGTDDDGNGYVDDCSGWDFANNDATVDDQIGHGTHVAGIIAAQANNRIGIAGVAYEAEVMVLKIGDGTPALSAAIEAIGYAIDNGAKVINASWIIDDPAAGPYLDVALAAAEAAGILFVTGAGNEPVDLDTNPVFPASSPADNVIVAGASTAMDEPAGFSGFGATTVDLFAPGEHIISTVPGGYGVYSGTSMAAPMVAGAAALLWAATPEATVEEVRGTLLGLTDSPEDGTTAFRDLASSDGRLNIGRSLDSQLFQPSLMFDFHEFDTFTPETPHKVAVIAKTVDPWIVPSHTPSMYRAGLYVPMEEQPMAVVGHEITYTGAGGDLTVTTDATGRALVGRVFEQQQRPSLAQEGDFTPLAMELPAGTYAFVMEIVDISVPEAPIALGDPSAVFFIVHDDGTVSEMPDPPPVSVPTTGAPGGPGPTVTSTTAAAPTTTTALTVTTIATPTSRPDATTTTTTPATTTLPAPPTTLSPEATTTAPSPTTTTSELPATTASAPGDDTGGDGEQPPDLCTDLVDHDDDDDDDDDDGDDDDGDDGDDDGGDDDGDDDDGDDDDGDDDVGDVDDGDDDDGDDDDDDEDDDDDDDEDPCRSKDDGSGEEDAKDTSGMAITRINPASGPVTGGSLVTITGSNLPEDPEVLFGERRAELISVVAPNFIVVNTPAGNPGWVDVSVVDRETGATTVLAQGFAYLEEGQAPPETTTTTTTTTLPGATLPPTSSPATLATTTAAPTTTMAPTTTATLPEPEQVSIDDWVDSMLRTPEGLTLAPPAADAAIGRIPVSLWIGELCEDPVCPGWVLEN